MIKGQDGTNKTPQQVASEQKGGSTTGGKKTTPATLSNPKRRTRTVHTSPLGVNTQAKTARNKLLGV